MKRAAMLAALALVGCDQVVHQDVGAWIPRTGFHDCTYEVEECGWDDGEYECRDVTHFGEQWADLETRMRIVYWKSERKTLESDVKVIKIYEPCHAHGKSKLFPPKRKTNV